MSLLVLVLYFSFLVIPSVLRQMDERDVGVTKDLLDCLSDISGEITELSTFYTSKFPAILKGRSVEAGKTAIEAAKAIIGPQLQRLENLSRKLEKAVARLNDPGAELKKAVKECIQMVKTCSDKILRQNTTL